jgi:hypothetical protein
MFADKFIAQEEIVDGQYTVSIDLKGFLKPAEIDSFKSDFKELQETCSEDLNDIYKLKGDKIR